MKRIYTVCFQLYFSKSTKILERNIPKCLKNKKPFHVVVDLGKALSLALEFKMGAEIIKTVIVHNLEELSILGVVILIRALLAFIIHWEIKAEEKDTAIKTQKDTTQIKD